MKDLQEPTLVEVPTSRWSSRARTWLENRQVDRVVAFDVQLTTMFRGVRARRGILLHGPGGWGECAPFTEYDPAESALWLQSAVEAATHGIEIPAARDSAHTSYNSVRTTRDSAHSSSRESVPVNVTIPVVAPVDAAARARVAHCATAKIKVADTRSTLQQDWNRIRAVSEVLAHEFGETAHVRVDVNGKWGRDEALAAINFLAEAAAPVGGFEYVEQPCMAVEDLAWVRAHTSTPIAADESIRREKDPFRVVELEAADIAVVKVAPLGGVRRALELAEQLPIPVVVSSAIDTSIGLAAGVALAAALPELPHACGLDTQRLLVGDVAGPLVSADGALSLADARRIAAGKLFGGQLAGDETSSSFGTSSLNDDGAPGSDTRLGSGSQPDPTTRPAAADLVDSWVARTEAMIAARWNEETE